ncbi:hypothetical protein SPFL3102_02650 [Sporomusaceae bacterium FL31]|nr:hypothetical protein SPFL3101_02625 [Sporomusaceae bacterium FL31]GCE34823.1 hypothetical protein SPFL3102_02650 [Sporomusaceae bacterium]
MTITCTDTDCKYNTSGNCTATAIDHTSDRFCVTGRRRPRDEIRDAMQTFNAGCRPTQSGYKAVSGKVLR